MAYLVIRLFSKINLKQPFNKTASKSITQISEVQIFKKGVKIQSENELTI